MRSRDAKQGFKAAERQQELNPWAGQLLQKECTQQAAAAAPAAVWHATLGPSVRVRPRVGSLMAAIASKIQAASARSLHSLKKQAGPRLKL